MRSGGFASICLLLLSTACQTTLNDYKCKAAQDCIGVRVGRCEPDNHCSFPDALCSSGFRYGENSGSASDRCVTEISPSTDAGMSTPKADARQQEPTRPLAVIDAVAPECGETTANIDGADSIAYKGANIVNLEWTISDPGGMELDRFSGAPYANVVPGTHRQGGVYEFPEINLPRYHGARLFLVEPRSNGGELDTLFHDGIQVPDDADVLQLYFSIGSQTAVAPVTVSVRTPSTEVGTLTVDVKTVMTSHLLNISLADAGVTGDQGPFRVKFAFEEQGKYYLDSIAVTDPSGSIYTQNASVELVIAPWYTANSNGTPRDLKRALLPSSLREAGTYELSLVVHDSNGLESLPAKHEIVISHNCL